MTLQDMKDIAETAIKIARMISNRPAARQVEIMAVAQMFVNIEAQRSATAQAQQQSRVPEDEEFHA